MPASSTRDDDPDFDRRDLASPQEVGGAVGPSLGAGGLKPPGTRSATRRGGPGLVGQLVGVVGGGVLGLAIGYYLLNWIGGPQFNFLDIPLPGLPAQRGAQNDLARQPHDEEDRIGAADREMPVDDRSAPLAAQPQPADVLETPPIEEAPQLPPDYVGPRNVETRSLEELSAAVRAAKSLLICDRCQSTGYVNGSPGRAGAACPECGGKVAGPIDRQAFAILCQLADAATFAEPEPDEVSNIRRKEALRSLMLRAALPEERIAQIGRLAWEAVEGGDRRSRGIAVAGVVAETGRAGRLHWAKIRLSGSNDQLTAVSRLGLPARAGEPLLVLGSVVERPAEELVGYEGDLPWVIWVGASARLP